MISMVSDRVSEILGHVIAAFDPIFTDGNTTVIVASTVALLFLFRRLRSRFWLFFHLTFPSTLMHELTHYVVSLVSNGKPQGLSVVPFRTQGGLVLGHVTSMNMRWYNGTAIALAPISLMLVAYCFFVNFLQSETSFYWLLPKAYLLASLIEGGVPSASDFRIGLRYSLAPVTIFIVYLTKGFIGLHQ